MPSPGRSMRHSKFSNLKFSPCSRLVIPRGLNLPTKSQARRAQSAQSHHVVAMERVLCECGDELLCARMQKGCPDSWWYTINRRNGNWREEILKNLFNFDAPRAHLGIIRSSRLGTRDFFSRQPVEGRIDAERRNQICPVPDESEIDWLKRLRQNTFLAAESAYKTINFQLFPSLSLGSVVF